MYNTQANISLTFFSSKSFFVQRYGPNYGECHVYKAKMYVETNFSSNIYDSLTLSLNITIYMQMHWSE